MYRLAIAAALAAAIAASAAVYEHGITEPDSDVAGLPADVTVDQLVQAAMSEAERGKALRPSAQLAALRLQDDSGPAGMIADRPAFAGSEEAAARRICDPSGDGTGRGQNGPLNLLETGKTCIVSGKVEVYEPASSHAMLAEFSADESLSVRRSANRVLGLRSRQGPALGPSDASFDLLKPGVTPPASSNVKSTSDYTP